MDIVKNNVTQSTKRLTVVAISDIHGCLRNPADWPAGDVLCICGDIMPLNIQREIIPSIAWLCTTFFPWIQSLPYKKVLMVAGNHDFIFERLRIDSHGNHVKPKGLMRQLMAPAKLELLEDSGCTVDGFEFWGSPWIPDLKKWAFYAESDELTRQFKKIRDNTDVVITHCPPKIGLYGVVTGGWGGGTDYGCIELTQAIEGKKPMLSVFGHVHTGDHVAKRIGDTVYCNVSAMDEEYKYIYEPQVFNLYK